ncbi:MAG: hypothetical protein EXR43_04885 [Dehalococcoidia bacterium]|nr:hypothetical protein [Dehalococcoidia bacterium]
MAISSSYRRGALTIIALVAVALAIRSSPGFLQPAGAAAPTGTVPNEIIVGYTGGHAPDLLAARVDMLGGTIVEHLTADNADRIRLPGNMPYETAARLLRRLPGVAFVEPNALLHAEAAPNDPLYAQQEWYTKLIGLPAAWDRQTGLPGVTVAVIDTGIDREHEDLRARLWINAREIPGDGIDNDQNGCIDDVNGCNFVTLLRERITSCGYTASVPNSDIFDDSGHGTRVAGVIGAPNNRLGMAGIAPNVRLMTVKAMDCDRAGTSIDVAKAIDYAVANGARVINLSLAGSTVSTVLSNAIDRATTAGTLVLAAAGNSGTSEIAFPASLPNVVAVGASGGAGAPDKRASFSNWGRQITVVAPGEDILTTTRDNGYRLSSGTSFSTPIVAGVAGLLLSQNPTLSVTDLVVILRSSAIDLPDRAEPYWDGDGRVKVDAALARVPSTFTGRVLLNGRPAPGGLPVTALVGGVVCGGGSTVASAGGATSYTFQVPATTARAGCGTVGAPVEFVLAGSPTPITATWQGALQQQDLRITLPAQHLLLQQGWNLISLPVDPVSTSIIDILAPIAGDVVSVFGFDSIKQEFTFYLPEAPAISTLREMKPGQGFWILLRRNATLDVAGLPLPPRMTVSLSKGLNLVGASLSSPISLDSLLRTSFQGEYLSILGFSDGPKGEFVIRVSNGPAAFTTLNDVQPGKGYWFIMATEGKLTFP